MPGLCEGRQRVLESQPGTAQRHHEEREAPAVAAVILRGVALELVVTSSSTNTCTTRIQVAGAVAVAVPVQRKQQCSKEESPSTSYVGGHQ